MPAIYYDVLCCAVLCFAGLEGPALSQLPTKELRGGRHGRIIMLIPKPKAPQLIVVDSHAPTPHRQIGQTLKHHAFLQLSLFPAYPAQFAAMACMLMPTTTAIVHPKARCRGSSIRGSERPARLASHGNEQRCVATTSEPGLYHTSYLFFWAEVPQPHAHLNAQILSFVRNGLPHHHT